MNDEEKEKKRAKAHEYYHRKKLTCTPQANHVLVKDVIYCLSVLFIHALRQ